MSGTTEQVQKAQEYEQQGRFRELLERVMDSPLEDQTEEVLGGDEDRAAVVAVRSDGKTMLYWLIFVRGEDMPTDTLHFYNVLDFARDISVSMFKSKLISFTAEAESRRSRFSEQELAKSLHTIEASAEIVQLLDSDERTEQIICKWTRILGEHFGVDTVQVFRIYPDRQMMDVLCEWCAEGQVPYFDKTKDQRLEPWCLTEKPVVYSADSATGEHWEGIRGIGVSALMLFPIVLDGEIGRLALSVNYREKKHVWSTAEIKFAADAVKVLRSVLARKQQSKSLTGFQQITKEIMDNVSCAVYVKERLSGEVLFANRKLQNTFATELKENSFDSLVQEGIERGQETGCYEIHHIQRDRWYDVSFHEVTWIDGRQATLYSFYDITDKKLYQRKIEQQAYTDFLTGLYNRMCCERDLARQIDQAKKAGTTGALLYLDLDDFKHINDGLGHQYGDVLLKAISNAIMRVRGIENNCYRMGGDEFVIVITPDNYYRIDGILEDICSIFVKPWFLKDADYYCTMSMGVVTFPDLGESVADLVKKADIAMYEAKRDGKNRVVRYSEEINSASGRRLDMEKSMRDATVEGYNEFEIYYQPIVDVQNDSKCTGAEALIRWNSAKLGFIPPAEFIPLAEYLGLINPIGNYVLKEACRVCHQWNENGYPDYKVNVNLSVVQLLQPDVVEIVEAAIEETGITPRNLTLEVTESLAINDMDRMKGILERIKALGVRIALDDFGTGYSSLNHIREIPVDIIKVDQSFVKALARDAYSQSFVKMVAELAQTLGVYVCVEGIETEAQHEVLRDMKVKYIQGYYFDRPMRQADFERKYCPEKELAK